jgi:hypothetical protein
MNDNTERTRRSLDIASSFMPLSDIKQLANAAKTIERLHVDSDNVREAVATVLVVAHDALIPHMLELFNAECRRLENIQFLLANTGYVAESEAFGRARIQLEKQMRS